MSWLIGAVGNITNELRKQVSTLADSQLVKHDDANLLIIAGGIKKTCLFQVDNTNRENFVSVGVGIINNENTIRFMDDKLWENINSVEEARKLEGHFVNVRWNKGEVKIFTDVLGLRDIYYSSITNDCIIFSTRGDWLAKILRAEINFKEFGSRWLLFNQISPNSIFNNIERICGGKSIVIDRGNYKITADSYEWLPDFENKHLSINDYSSKLEELINIPFVSDHRVSLSLSGGMDSRLILSYLIQKNKRTWYSHTFGDYDHPDSMVAQKIATDLRIEHERINLEETTPEIFLAEAKDYLLQTNVNNAVSGYLQLRNYKNLIGRNEVIIDGGFGEIWRREFFNRILVRGRKNLNDKDTDGMIPYLRVHRADVFTEDIKNTFYKGCKEQLENSFKTLPDANTIGMENWIDLFAVKTRLLNYYSSAQVHLDGWVFSYMPFIQQSLLKNLFNTSLSKRKNGKMFRQIIKQNYKTLSNYPLAKGQFTHPFFLNTIQSRIWNIAYKKLKLKMYNDNSTEHLLNTLSPYIQDTITSASVKQCGYYDYSKLLRLSNVVAKDTASSYDLYELDWWFAFELFRQEITQ